MLVSGTLISANLQNQDYTFALLHPNQQFQISIKYIQIMRILQSTSLRNMHYNYRQPILKHSDKQHFLANPKNRQFVNQKVTYSTHNSEKINGFIFRMPTSVRNNDEGVNRLSSQYQLLSTRNAQINREGHNIIEKTPTQLSKSFQSPNNFKPGLSFSRTEQHQSQMRQKLLQSPTQLSSIDYLRIPRSRQIVKENRESEATTNLEDGFRSQPCHSQMLPSFRTCIQDQYFTELGCHQKSCKQQKLESYSQIFKKDTNNIPKNTKQLQVEITDCQQKTLNLQKQNNSKESNQPNRIIDDQIINYPKVSSETLLQKTEDKTHNSKLQHFKKTYTNCSKVAESQIQTNQNQIQSIPMASRQYIEVINKKNRIIVKLQSQNFRLQTQCKQKQQQTQKYKLEIEKLKSSQKQAIQESNKLILKLKKQIDLNDANRHSLNLDLQSKFRKINIENQQISALNNTLNRDITNVKKELQKKYDSQSIQQEMYSRLKSIIQSKTAKIVQLQKDLDRTLQQNSVLRKRIAEVINEGAFSSKNFIQNQDSNDIFNNIMKMNEEENTKYKNNMNLKNQQIHRLQDVNREIRGVNDTLRNDIEIQKLKRITELKNLQTSFKIEEQAKINQISSLNCTLLNMEEKLKFIIAEDRKKDDFMVSYLKSRVQLAEDRLRIDDFFKRFELLSVNTNIVQRLKRQEKQIQLLKAEVRKLILKK